MPAITVRPDEATLPELLDRVERGEDMIIERDGKPVARLVPYREAQATGRRQGGQWRGLVRIAPDFDELPPDLFGEMAP